GVQVDRRRLVAAVATALPGIHRAAQTLRAGGGACRRQPPPPVEQQRSCDLGKPQRIEREDEQLVPEDVAPVCLAVQPAGGNSDVEIGGVLRQGLQQVEYVQIQQP